MFKKELNCHSAILINTDLICMIKGNLNMSDFGFIGLIMADCHYHNGSLD